MAGKAHSVQHKPVLKLPQCGFIPHCPSLFMTCLSFHPQSHPFSFTSSSTGVTVLRTVNTVVGTHSQVFLLSPLLHLQLDSLSSIFLFLSLILFSPPSLLHSFLLPNLSILLFLLYFFFLFFPSLLFSLLFL